MLVVDASAIAALLFGEPSAENIAEQLGQVPLVAPSLLWFEVASVCLKKIVAHPRIAHRLFAALTLLDNLNVTSVPIEHSVTVQLAREHKLTVYDASYLWLARHLRVRMVTLDKRLQAVAETVL
jgi:predicted nucleic acid-binding protein